MTAGRSITPTTRPATAIAATRSSSAWSTRFQLACTTAATSTRATAKGSMAVSRISGLRQSAPADSMCLTFSRTGRAGAGDA
jgi:hypothetical protein